MEKGSARSLSLFKLWLFLSFFDKFSDRAFKLINLLAHFIDPTDNVAIHLTEASLHLVEHLRHQVRQLLRAVYIVGLLRSTVCHFVSRVLILKL